MPRLHIISSKTACTSLSGTSSALERFRAGEIDRAQYVELRVNEATEHLDGVLPPSDLDAVRDEVHSEILAGVEFAKASPHPALEAVGEHVYAD